MLKEKKSHELVHTGIVPVPNCQLILLSYLLKSHKYLTRDQTPQSHLPTPKWNGILSLPSFSSFCFFSLFHSFICILFRVCRRWIYESQFVCLLLTWWKASAFSVDDNGKVNNLFLMNFMYVSNAYRQWCIECLKQPQRKI